MFFIVPLIILFAILFWAIMKYNILVTMKNQVTNAWSQIDIQLKRRHDLIPNLVNTVKGYMEFEQDTLRQVIQARNAAASAKGVADSAVKEGELTQLLSRLFSLVENYPELKANENVRTLMEELTSTENTVSFSRQFYNDITTKFNTSQQTFPGNIIAGMFTFKLAELFELKVPKEREAPVVNLSMRS
ncbi:MAG: LemA family protein [Ignavibacteriae bacterium]|nr:LemA family protein [Ignavibacteriota bacterium]